MTYSSGYSLQEQEQIKERRKLIVKRDLAKEPITMLEVKETIVPFCRIHRVEQFILHPIKVTTKKVATIKRTRTKKLTKKQIGQRLGELIFKLASTGKLEEEDQRFYDAHTKQEDLL